MEQHNHKALALSIGEEAKAFSDYRCRAEDNKWTELEELFEHLAGEESKHLAMLIVQLSDECPTFKEHLDEFYWQDVLEVEKD